MHSNSLIYSAFSHGRRRRFLIPRTRQLPTFDRIFLPLARLTPIVDSLRSILLIASGVLHVRPNETKDARPADCEKVTDRDDFYYLHDWIQIFHASFTAFILAKNTQRAGIKIRNATWCAGNLFVLSNNIYQFFTNRINILNPKNSIKCLKNRRFLTDI